MKAMMKILALSVPLLSLFAHQSHVLAQGTTSGAECERDDVFMAVMDESICSFITGDYQLQAEECLNVTIKAPSPVVLESTIVSENLICRDKPTLYAFSCTLYGVELLWYFNEKIVTGFFNLDRVGRTVSILYPESAPVYNVTAMLTLVSNESLSQYNVPFCVSILTIQSFNESQADAPVIPFNVSCRTHCADGTEVCQVKTYQVAETPTAPEELNGTIQNISDTTVTQTGAKAIVSLTWSLPENEDATAIDYYEITLMGTHTNSTISMCMTDQSLQTLSYKYVLSEGNYTAASIAAVDLCGQKSEPAELTLINMTTTDLDMISNVATCDTQQSQVTSVGAGLGVPLVVITITAVTFLITVIILAIKVCSLRHQQGAASAISFTVRST